MKNRLQMTRLALMLLAMAALLVPTVAAAVPSKKTSVTKLRAYKQRVHKRTMSSLPAPALEVFENAGGDPATLQEPLIGKLQAGAPRVFVFKGKGGSLCIVQSRDHAQGGCFTGLVLAGGKIGGGLGVMDGITYASGLVANGVRDLSVTIDGAATEAVIANNTWFAVLPDGSTGTSAAKLRGSDADGAAVTATLPGIPVPVGP